MADSTNAQIGSQTRLLYYDALASPAAYVPFANIRSFGEVGSDRPEVDSTDLDSLAVERIGGLPDGKEITIVCVGNSVTINLFKAQYNAAQNLDLQIDFPAPIDDQLYFSLAPLGFSLGTITPDGLVECTLRGRISGPITDSFSPGI